jgi:hypothetical protein
MITKSGEMSSGGVAVTSPGKGPAAAATRRGGHFLALHVDGLMLCCPRRPQLTRWPWLYLQIACAGGEMLARPAYTFLKVHHRSRASTLRACKILSPTVRRSRERISQAWLSAAPPSIRDYDAANPPGPSAFAAGQARRQIRPERA